MSSCLPDDSLQRMLPLLDSLAQLIATGGAAGTRQLRTLLAAAGLEATSALLTELGFWSRLLQSVREAPDGDGQEVAVRGLMLRGVPEAAATRAVRLVAEPRPTPGQTEEAGSVAPLQPHIVQELIPLLDGVAWLVAQGVTLDDRHIQALLIAANVAISEEVIRELELWARWLQVARTQTDDVSRHAIVGRLMQRGLPKSPILLAMTTVTAPCASPVQPRSLVVRPPRLYWGQLMPGQGAVAELEIRGGPGRILWDSQQLQVTPTEFGSASTRVRVHLSPMADGDLLWACLKLVTADGVVEVPAQAYWEAPEPAASLEGEAALPTELSEEEIQQLAIGLGWLARLIAAGLVVETQHLRALLASLKLTSTPRRLRELRIWARLLQAGRSASDTAARQIVADNLVLRGLPRAHVQQALASLAGQGTPAPSVDGASAVPWPEVIRLVAATPELTPVVAPDGSGSYRSLGEALADAVPGATIYLRRGVHRLGQGVLLNKPVVLVGEGMDNTELVADQGSYTLRYEGEGLLGLFDLALRWEGRPGVVANVVSVQSGEVQIERCRFSGATCSARAFGAGLELAGTCRGTVNGCQLRNNGFGILVSAQAAPTLEDNVCQANLHSGMAFLGSAGGTARRNTCSDNQAHGIYLGEQAQPLLEANTCQANQQDGIHCEGQSTAMARRNVCTGNGNCGIGVHQYAQPTLESNTCQANIHSGIAYYHSAAGIARQNVCNGNRRYGIYATDRAQPGLEANTCQANRLAGIFYFGTAAGIARQNVCALNDKHGIYLGERAQPTLEANICRNNRQVGIICMDRSTGVASQNTCSNNQLSGMAYFGYAAGVARQNICNGNQMHGIYLSDQAQPTLEANVCQGNKRDGISYWGNAGGSAQSNQCLENGENGIYVAAGARPRLKDNRSQDTGKSV